VRSRSLEQSFVQAALEPEAPLDTEHAAVVALVIVAQEMKEAVESQHSQFGLLAVSRFACLAPRHASGDHDVAEEWLSADG
jgi:hypothetical protein